MREKGADVRYVADLRGRRQPPPGAPERAGLAAAFAARDPRRARAGATPIRGRRGAVLGFVSAAIVGAALGCSVNRTAADTPESFERLNRTPRALTLKVTPAGKRKSFPSGFEQAIPGIMVMFTLLVLILATSESHWLMSTMRTVTPVLPRTFSATRHTFGGALRKSQSRSLNHIS